MHRDGRNELIVCVPLAGSFSGQQSRPTVLLVDFDLSLLVVVVVAVVVVVVEQ